MDIARAMEKLEHAHPRAARVVDIHCFVGLSVQDTAKLLGISPRTVKSDTAFAIQFFRKILNDDDTSIGVTV